MKHESAELKGILADIWHGNGAMTTEPVTKAIITIEGAAPSLQEPGKPEAAAPAPKKKGLGRLLEKDEKEDEEVIILE